MTDYFFDSYAIIEISKGNKNYQPYLEAQRVINDFVLAEICYSFIKEGNEKLALEYMDALYAFSVRTDAQTIRQAMLFRHENRKNNFSMADSIGYTQAKKLGLKFLTGDKQFENLPNVEFVK
jgi:predicted nucleic acid-binding protein